MPRRRTRKEQQAHTRSCLMRSAAKVFALRGLQQASIDEVAEDAGFTKGAFYANFKSKEELFLAMLDERFADRLEEIERATSGEEEP
jgi:AcrR family transcriptional regulator